MHPCVRVDILKGQDSPSVIVDILRGCIDQNYAMLGRYMDITTGECRVFMAPKSVQSAAKYFRIMEIEVLFCRK